MCLPICLRERSSGWLFCRLALRLIVWSLIAFHGSSGVLEIYAYLQGAGVAIIGNVAARAIIVILFAWLSRKPAKLD
jgi:hypothetical protein